MQCKKLEKVAPVQPENNRKYVITAQLQEDILILDVFKEGAYRGRHAIHTETGEYMQYNLDFGSWKQHKFGNLLDLDMQMSGYYSYTEARQRTYFDTKKMEQMAREALISGMKISSHYTPETFDLIRETESDYARSKRERIEDNRVMKVQKKMQMVPQVPEETREWIWKREGAENFVFFDKESQRWHCSGCGKSIHERYLHREDKGKKIRHNDRVICPRCGETGTAKKRTDKIEKKSFFYMAQRIDDRMSVWRAFDVRLIWTKNGRKVRINEGVRIIMYSLAIQPKYVGDIFYNCYSSDGTYRNPEDAYFDNKNNQANRRMKSGYLYPEGIEDALKGTAYQGWGYLMRQFAAAGQKLNYNNLLSTQINPKLTGVVEYLFKGRFWRLLENTVDAIWPASGTYYGPLNISRDSIEDIFGIQDRQKINWLRDINGGNGALKWIRFSDGTGTKINQETLQWLTENGIVQADIDFILGQMSPQQVMNYVRRQQTESYKGKTAKAVIEQWNDYMRMLKTLGRKTDDEMMYRPRELKRRHDECVEEINRQRIRKEMKRNARERAREAQKMRERFPGAEEILQEIKEKYEYQNDQYVIKVPQRLSDIIAEGQALHHCAGATDRYFDRIMQRETYICFLRQASDPKTPYYTIEVEPGGTIRQHRGMYDEEPNIEKVKPFLKEWQKEIHKRMTREDREHAAASAVKRRQNIEELKANRNTRVLQGLMEDFMPQENAEENMPENVLMAAGA